MELFFALLQKTVLSQKTYATLATLTEIPDSGSLPHMRAGISRC